MCSFPECEKDDYCGGLCRGHYAQRRKGQTLRPLQDRGKPNRYVVVGDEAHIILVDREGTVQGFARVSIEDLDRVLRFRWHRAAKGYVAAHVYGTTSDTIFLHRYILDAPEQDEVDHKNGDRLNCTRPNLRLGTLILNSENRGSTGATGYRNIYRYGDRYRVAVVKNRKQHWGGYHDTIEEAEEEARKLRARLFTFHNEERSRAS